MKEYLLLFSEASFEASTWGSSWRATWTTESWLTSSLDLSFFDVSLSSVDSCNLDIVNQMLSGVLILEGNETEASRLAGIDVLQDAGV